MTFWIWAWCAVMTLFTLAGVWIDRSEHEPWWYVAVGLFGGLGCPVCVLNAYAVVDLGDLRWFAGAVLAALVFSTWRDVEKYVAEGSLTRGESAAAIVLNLVLYAPAAFMGFETR